MNTLEKLFKEKDSCNSLSDIQIIFIDENDTSIKKSVNYHSQIIFINSNFFKKLFTFNNEISKSREIFIPDIDIAEDLLNIFYNINKFNEYDNFDKIRSLIHLCDYFEIEFDFDWLNFNNIFYCDSLEDYNNFIELLNRPYFLCKDKSKISKLLSKIKLNEKCIKTIYKENPNCYISIGNEINIWNNEQKFLLSYKYQEFKNILISDYFIERTEDGNIYLGIVGITTPAATRSNIFRISNLINGENIVQKNTSTINNFIIYENNIVNFYEGKKYYNSGFSTIGILDIYNHKGLNTSKNFIIPSNHADIEFVGVIGNYKRIVLIETQKNVNHNNKIFICSRNKFTMKILLFPEIEYWIPATGLFIINTKLVINFKLAETYKRESKNIDNYIIIKYNANSLYGLPMIKDNKCGFLFIDKSSKEIQTEWVEIDSNSNKFSSLISKDFVIMDNNDIWSIKEMKLLSKFEKISLDNNYIFTQI